MVKISSNNEDTAKSIAHICDYLEKNGSYINAGIEILDADGQTSILANNEVRSEYAFKIQHDLLIPYGNFDFDIEKQDIVIAHDDRNANKQHLELLEAMLTRYNVSGNFRHHLNKHPVLRFNKHPDLIRQLLSAREGRDIDIIAEIIDKPDFHDELALLTFFRDKLLNCPLHNIHEQYTAVLIPGIEFMNHHSKGANFDNLYGEGGNQLATKIAMPVSDSKECFRSYGRFDALDTYLHCGFIDEDVKYVRSVPLKIDLGSIGIISIRAFNTIVPVSDIPDHLQDLAFYFPKMHFDSTHKIAELSHIFIPQENARFSLRRILEHVIQNLEPNISQSECLNAIGVAENQIIAINTEYNDELERNTVEITPDSQNENPIFSLLETQRKKIKKYTHLANH